MCSIDTNQIQPNFVFTTIQGAGEEVCHIDFPSKPIMVSVDTGLIIVARMICICLIQGNNLTDQVW